MVVASAVDQNSSINNLYIDWKKTIPLKSINDHDYHHHRSGGGKTIDSRMY